MRELLKDRTAIITGGTAGIGKAIARMFAEEGARVAIFGRNAERGAKTVEEINRLLGEDRTLFYQVDVSRAHAVEQAVKSVLEIFKIVDVLVNNAGVNRDQLLIRMTEADWDDVMAINVKSCYHTCRAVVRSMMKARRGKIINLSSVVGLVGNAGQANYAASKAAIIGFTKALAKELASRNICVNCIAPGFIETEMTEGMGKEILSMIPFKRMGAPEDIAKGALFLASSLSDYMTGQVITIDGGMVM